MKVYFEFRPAPVFFEVRQGDLERLQAVVDRFNRDADGDEFFWCNTVDGKSIAFNLRFAQALHFLWDPSLPPDLTRYEGPIQIWLKGRTEPLEIDGTDVPDELYDFFTNLEHGPDVVSFPYFEDNDGERIWVNGAQVIYVLAPAHVVQEGAQIAREQDGIE